MYDHMALQFENCIVIVQAQALYSQLDCLFAFDHSCGHDCRWEDWLNVGNMEREAKPG
jgi:hypothetical protein